MCLVGCNQLGDGSSVYENFHNCATSAAVRRLAQNLRAYGLEAHRQKGLGLLAQFARQSIDDSVDCFDSAGRVQGAEDEVSGLGSSHRHHDGLGIT